MNLRNLVWTSHEREVLAERIELISCVVKELGPVEVLTILSGIRAWCTIMAWHLMDAIASRMASADTRCSSTVDVRLTADTFVAAWVFFRALPLPLPFRLLLHPCIWTVTSTTRCWRKKTIVSRWLVGCRRRQHGTSYSITLVAHWAEVLSTTDVSYHVSISLWSSDSCRRTMSHRDLAWFVSLSLHIIVRDDTWTTLISAGTKTFSVWAFMVWLS